MGQVIQLKKKLDLITTGRINNKNREILESWSEHLLCAKEVDGKIYALSKFLFTTGFLLDVSELSYTSRYCFHTHQQALAFFIAYDGTQEAVVGQDGCTAIK